MREKLLCLMISSVGGKKKNKNNHPTSQVTPGKRWRNEIFSSQFIFKSVKMQYHQDPTDVQYLVGRKQRHDTVRKRYIPNPQNKHKHTQLASWSTQTKQKAKTYLRLNQRCHPKFTGL